MRKKKENVKWYIPYGKQYGGSSKDEA